MTDYKRINSVHAIGLICTEFVLLKIFPINALLIMSITQQYGDAGNVIEILRTIIMNDTQVKVVPMLEAMSHINVYN